MVDQLPEVSLVNSVASENLQDALTDVGEKGVGILLDSDVLRDIPVFGTLTRLYRATREIQHQIYLRKVLRFLHELSSVPSYKRQEFIRNLGDEILQQEFGETILLLLERADNMQKPVMIGKIMAACIEGRILYEEALRLCYIVDRSYVQDLNWLRSFKPGLQDQHDPIAQALNATGVLTINGIDGGGATAGGGVGYELTRYGQLLLQHLFSNNEQV